MIADLRFKIKEVFSIFSIGVMQKRIKDLTNKDKEKYLQAVKRELEKNDVPWDFYEKKIREEIDNTFNDAAFGKMNPEFAIDAAYAREYFRWKEKQEKPELVDYILWMGYFATKSEYVEIP